jgi:hypothetical protein
MVDKRAPFARCIDHLPVNQRREDGNGFDQHRDNRLACLLCKGNFPLDGTVVNRGCADERDKNFRALNSCFNLVSPLIALL